MYIPTLSKKERAFQLLQFACAQSVRKTQTEIWWECDAIASRMEGKHLFVILRQLKLMGLFDMRVKPKPRLEPTWRGKYGIKLPTIRG